MLSVCGVQWRANKSIDGGLRRQEDVENVPMEMR